MAFVNVWGLWAGVFGDPEDVFGGADQAVEYDSDRAQGA